MLGQKLGGNRSPGRLLAAITCTGAGFWTAATAADIIP